MPMFKKKKPSYSGEWVNIPDANPDARVSADPDATGDQLANVVNTPAVKNKKVFRVVTVRGRQEQAWLDSNLWQPMVETIYPEEAKAPLMVMYYGTYGSDGMRHDGAPGGAFSSVYEQYAMTGGDLYTRDEARVLKQWDTRKPFPGFDPKLGSKTLDIYSED